MLPLINRGATPVSGDPTDGVENAMIAGHPIEIVYGGSDSTPDKAVEEARRLVEQEGVDILVGPLSGSEGIAVAELLEGAAGSHVRERHLGRAGHDAQGAVSELLPLPQRRHPVDGGARRLRL